MAKTAVWVVGAVAAVVAAGVGSMVVIGKKVETLMDTETRAAIAQFAPVVKVVDLKYEKSFTGATRTVTLQIGCEGDAVPVTWKDTIQYGPLPGFSHVGLAHIDTEFVLTDEAKKQLKEALGLDSVPLKIQTSVGLSGGLDSVVNVAGLNIEKEGGQFNVAASSMRFTRSAGGQVSSDTKFPSVTLAVPNDRFRFEMKGYTAHSEGGTGPYWWSTALGSGTASMGSLEFSATMPERDGFEEESLPTPDAGKKFVFKVGAVEARTTSSVEKDLISLSTGFTANNIQFNDLGFDKFEIKEGIQRIHQPTLNAVIEKLINKEMLTYMCGAGTFQERMNQYVEERAKDISTLVAKLLPFDPAYSVDKVAFTKAGKEGSIGYSFGVKGVTQQEAEEALQNPTVLMKKAVASAQARIPLSWISMAANAFVPQMGITDAQVEAQIQPIVQMGFVVREGDYLVSKGEFKDGKPTINGKPYPPGAQ